MRHKPKKSDDPVNHPTEEVRSANNSDQSNPVIAAQIQVVIEINHSTDDSRPDEPDLGVGILEFHGFIQF